MTKPRETKYARGLASAKLPSGPGGKSSVAIERLHVKQADQVKIRFSRWTGSRMMPMPLDLLEEELLQPLGTTANAVASMRALVTKYGPAPRAFLVMPLVGAFFIDNWLR